MNESNGQETVEGLHFATGKPVQVTIQDGKILKVKSIEKLSVENKNLIIAPGLIDIQINGYMGVDFAGPDLTLDGLHKATRELWANGVTTFLPTVITNSHDRLIKSFTVLAQTLDDPEIRNSIPGFHLEGPYISPVQGYRGAHLEKYIRKPDWNEFLELQKVAHNGIKLITLAPEIEGAIAFTHKCVKSGVVVSLGHHNGSAEEITEAVDAGASLCTHLGNGCANMINRHHNPIWPQLSDDRLSISIIADGYHLTKEEVRSFYKAKGVARTILISDALDLAGLPPGEYVRGERKVLLTQHVVKFPAENVLAGAASPVSVGVGNIMKFTQCSLENAIQMACTNPAKILGLNDRGKLKPGLRADLILFTLDDFKVNIKKTYVKGELVFEKQK
ncbi:MAG: N-acetylglucosamine-6-phosphate deacetylase [Draconibacterium sp.]|nr:N-acetylglucosamine-6-phosphate deacetylase [Draconibacterium sp.]